MGYKSINTKPSCNLWVILIFPPAVLCVWLTIKLRYRSKCGNVNLQICFVIKFHKLKLAWRIYLIAHASWPKMNLSCVKMIHNIIRNIFEICCNVPILCTLYDLYISILLPFTSHPTVILIKLNTEWPKKMYTHLTWKTSKECIHFLGPLCIYIYKLNVFIYLFILCRCTFVTFVY